MRNRIARVSLVMLIAGAIVWLGAVNVRAIIGNELLHFGTLEFRTDLDVELEGEVFRLISLSSVVVVGGYLVTFVSAVTFLRSSRLSLKQNGWFMMSAILFFMFSPVEFYTLYLDSKMMALCFFGQPALVELRTLFIHRLAALAGMPLIALLSYYTIIGLVVWQPLKK